MRNSPLARYAAATLSVMLSALATTGPSAAQEEDPKASLYVLTRSECVEDYASELAAAGISPELSAFDTLASIAKFLKVPQNVEVRHILFVRGYAIVNHVSPDRVADLLDTMPRIKGLIGSTECGANDAHAAVHARDVETF